MTVIIFRLIEALKYFGPFIESHLAARYKPFFKSDRTSWDFRSLVFAGMLMLPVRVCVIMFFLVLNYNSVVIADTLRPLNPKFFR